MIVKYFHYHVGSYVSKNTRGGDTIRLLIKLIVMLLLTEFKGNKVYFEKLVTFLGEGSN